MAAPVPSASTDAAENEEVRLPNNAEDRKAAAALNSLNANELSQENGDSAGSREPSTIDQEALNKAMSRLEVAGGSNKKHASKKEQENRDEVVKKKVKVASEDVNLLVSLHTIRTEDTLT